MHGKNVSHSFKSVEYKARSEVVNGASKEQEIIQEAHDEMWKGRRREEN